MGWICPECGSENSFLKTCCEACGEKITKKYLYEEKKADRYEHRLLGTTAITVAYNKRRRQLNTASVFVYAAVAIIVVITTVHFSIISGSALSALIPSEIQRKMELQIERCNNSAEDKLAFMKEERIWRIVSDLNHSAENMKTTFNQSIVYNKASADASFKDKVHLYRYDLFITGQGKKCAERVSQKMEWILVQIPHVIQTIRTFDPLKLIRGNQE